MYQVGDQVVYGFHGVCRVVNMEKQVIDKKAEIFLVLEPADQNGSQYLVPTSSEAAMSKLHAVLTREELEEMIQSQYIRQDAWIREENIRKQTYRELIVSGNRMELMRMVNTLYIHKTNQTAAGRKFHLADDNFLRDAEKLLASEIAVIMGMQFDEARNYLRNQLKCD